MSMVPLALNIVFDVQGGMRRKRRGARRHANQAAKVYQVRTVLSRNQMRLRTGLVTTDSSETPEARITLPYKDFAKRKMRRERSMRRQSRRPKGIYVRHPPGRLEAIRFVSRCPHQVDGQAAD